MTAISQSNDIFEGSGLGGNGKGKGKGSGKTRDNSGHILPRAINKVDIKIVERKTEVTKGLPVKMPKKIKDKSKEGYFGIGVYLVSPTSHYVRYNGHVYIGEEIREVIPQNGAADAGLLPGDVIVLVNGSNTFEGGESVVGPSPKLLILTIQRNGRFMQVPVQRDWVNTKKK